MDEKRPFRPACARAGQKRIQGDAVERPALALLQPARLEERREEVDMRRKLGDVPE